LSRLVLPTELPGNIQHAGMAALLQSSLVLEHTAQNNAEIKTLDTYVIVNRSAAHVL